MLCSSTVPMGLTSAREDTSPTTRPICVACWRTISMSLPVKVMTVTVFFSEPLLTTSVTLSPSFRVIPASGMVRMT